MIYVFYLYINYTYVVCYICFILLWTCIYWSHMKTRIISRFLYIKRSYVSRSLNGKPGDYIAVRCARSDYSKTQLRLSPIPSADPVGPCQPRSRTPKATWAAETAVSSSHLYLPHGRKIYVSRIYISRI